MSQNQGIKDWIYDKMTIKQWGLRTCRRFVALNRQACHTEPARRVYLCLRIGRALFMPSMWVLCGFYVPCIWAGASRQPCHANVGLCAGRHLWRRPIIVIRFFMETRHCISGCSGGVHSGLYNLFNAYIRT